MAEEFPYTTVPNTLRSFLKGVPQRAVPDKVSGRHLKSIGMKSSNDPSIVPVLKFVNLLDASGTPTDKYKAFRDKSKGPSVLGGLIRVAYKGLYSTYDDAHNQSEEVLTDFFRANSKLGHQAVKLQAATFKVMCEFADFGATAISAQVGEVVAAKVSSPGPYPEIHINLQIHLPESKDPAVYESIFQAIAKHVLKGS